MSLIIKNMVCQRCILIVEEILQLLGIDYASVKLGEVQLAGENAQLSAKDLSGLKEKLHAYGFELLEGKNSQLVAKIKAACLHYLNDTDLEGQQRLSEFISTEVNYDYKHLSQTFSSVEGMTIEQHYLQLRIEKVKELLVYNELSLQEIAYKLGFSSAAHLSGQFKKLTGLTPSYFRSQKNSQNRASLDSL